MLLNVKKRNGLVLGMKKFYAFILLFTVITVTHAQTTWGDSLSLQLKAVVQVSPAQIALSWPLDNDANTYVVYRKSKSASSWGAPVGTLSGTTIGFNDNTVSIGTWYDYKVTMTSSSSPIKNGYISSSIQLPANSNRGIAIVVVEDSYLSNPTYAALINRFIDDLEYDGWFPKRIDVNSADNVADVKTAIVTVYNENPAKTKSLILLGHVPIPHSGNLNPDGHPDHQGAWPTDLFYADMDGVWSDATVNNSTSGNPKNHNVPGDGRFDDDYLPTDVELQVGRIDFYDLPAFSETEEELMIKYLQKDHEFKMAGFMVEEKGLIDDNFTSYSEGFSQNGYRNFSPLVNTITIGDYFTEMNASSSNSYLWSYGCGGGTYTSAGGIGSTSNFASDSLNGVFTMLFGSYFGDWDYTNAFLRAPLANGNTLTNCWAGRPNWHFYSMGIGENIGYAAKLTQNNSSLYYSSTLSGLSKMITINLMGDPSLRMHYNIPPLNVSAIYSSGTTSLNWTSAGSTLFNVYRRHVDSVDFIKRNPSPISGTSFIDAGIATFGNYIYYIKSVELKTTPSGSYYLESLGTTDTVYSTVGLSSLEDKIELSLYPNPASEYLTIHTNQVENISLSIMSIQGQLLQEISLNTTVTIDISNYPSGMYLIQSSDKNFSQTWRFVKE